ncbi:MAG: GIY-YIG nuclease family protein [Deltaproteobacteria bacterium]|nr:GIY-YIG nuclease family protein [Deltaproteobacteria bacterium]
MDKQFCVYILASKRNGTLYLGVTSQLATRVWQHKSKVVEGFSAKYGVDKLVDFEAHGCAETAIVREKQLKKRRRAWKMTNCVPFGHGPRPDSTQYCQTGEYLPGRLHVTHRFVAHPAAGESRRGTFFACEFLLGPVRSMSWTELDTVEQSAGARSADFLGICLPRSFGAPEAEWRAVRHGAGVLDARNRQLLSLIGGDRVAFLHGMITNDVKRSTAGKGVYAALLTIQGRIVSDLYVYALADRLLLDVPAWRRQAVREALDHFIIADDVEFEETDLAPLLAIEGPDAADVLAAAAGQAPGEPAPFDHSEITIAGVSARCVAVSQTGEPGFRLLGRPGDAAELWRRLSAAGALPVGLDALNVLRLEAGIPWHGVDMDAETLVMETGLETAISFNKGCYLGQEVVERVAARGHVNRKLCGLVGDGEVPPPGAPLLHHDREAGHLTSAAHSPALGRVIALGYVERTSWAPGTVLRAGRQHLTITALPFYRRGD